MVSSWAIGRSKAILSNSNYWAASQRCTEREREVPQEIWLVKKQMLLHLHHFTSELLVTSNFPGTRGYMSFQCDGHVIKERRYYCCKVNGLLYLGLFQPWWPLFKFATSLELDSKAMFQQPGGYYCHEPQLQLPSEQRVGGAGRSDHAPFPPFLKQIVSHAWKT